MVELCEDEHYPFMKCQLSYNKGIQNYFVLRTYMFQIQGIVVENVLVIHLKDK